MTPFKTCENSCYPGELLSQNPADVAGRRWFVVRTMARQEKLLARELYQQRIPFYLPLLERRLSYKGRQAVSQRPVFAGYLFMFASDAERLSCLATRRAISAIAAPDGTRLARDLARVADAIASGSATHPTMAQLLQDDPSQNLSEPLSPTRDARHRDAKAGVAECPKV